MKKKERKKKEKKKKEREKKDKMKVGVGGKVGVHGKRTKKFFFGVTYNYILKT